MKQQLVMAIPAICIASLALWHWNHLRVEHSALVKEPRSTIKAAALKHAGPVEGDLPGTTHGLAKSSPITEELSALLLEIQAQETTIARIAREADDLAARLPARRPDELIASFGRIEDMGRDTGAALQGLIRMLAGETVSGPKDEANFMRLLRVKGQLPEIRSFESNPDEIARFQSSTLRQALGLSEATEAAMRPLIRDAFTELAAENLTASHMPPTPAEAGPWIARRSETLQRLMHQLRPHLPESDAPSTRAALMFALNVGAGLDEKTSLAPGAATLSLGVTWPQVPW